MKILKRISLVLAAVLLVATSLSIGVSATGETGTETVVITADKDANLYPGDIITFTINVTTDYMCTAMRWPIMFPRKELELVTVDGNIGNVQGYGSLNATGSDLGSEDQSDNTLTHAGKYNSVANYGCLLIQWVGLTNNGRANYYLETNGANCITFQMRVKAAPTTTTAEIIIPSTIQHYKDNFFYYQGTSDPENAVYYTMAQTDLALTTRSETVTYFKEAAAILPKSGTDTIIDTEHGYIYGLTRAVTDPETYGLVTTAAYPTYISCVGGATYTLTPNSQGTYSTGATLEAFDAGGNSLGVYEIILFGDVDGNAVIDTTDASLILDASCSVYEWSMYPDENGFAWVNAQFMACDTTGDAYVTGDDYGNVVSACDLTGYIGQCQDPVNTYISY